MRQRAVKFLWIVAVLSTLTAPLLAQNAPSMAEDMLSYEEGE